MKSLRRDFLKTTGILGEFNPETFKQAAHDRGLRLITTLVGDCANCKQSGSGEYVKDRGAAGNKEFFTDPVIIARFEKHIEALLNHRYSRAGVYYKDDPTVLAWENCNSCSLVASLTGAFNKSIDKKHIFEDNSGLLGLSAYDKTGTSLDSTNLDIITAAYYPDWGKVFGMGGIGITSEAFSKQADLVTDHGKLFVVTEHGWDWRGSAGAVKYSVERSPKATEPWILVCDKCATDADTPWVDAD
jgi:mannan endo-1,4-beta-mannosidase